MTDSVIMIPDGATARQILDAAQSVAREIADDWQTRMNSPTDLTDLVLEDLDVPDDITPADRDTLAVGRLIGELAADVGTLAHLVDKLTDLHRTALGIPTP